MNKRSIKVLGFYEIQGQLEQIASSRLAKEMARQLLPSADEQIVRQRIEETEEAYRCLNQETQIPLGGTEDIRQALSSAQKEIVLEPEECLAIWHNIERYRKMKGFFFDKVSEYPHISKIASEIDDFESLEREFNRVFDKKQQIKDTASPVLARVRNQILQLERTVKNHMQSALQNKDYQKFFQDSLVTIRNNRYVLPIKAEYRHAFPGIVHDRSASGSTLYVEPLALVQSNNDLQEAKIGELKEIQRIFKHLTLTVGTIYGSLYKSTMQVGLIEFIFSRASLALAMKAQRPQMVLGGPVYLVQARHPLIPADKVVPNTIELGDNYRILLITGSNTGGKTVAMKTLGLLVLMHQAGLFIPAGENSILPVFHEVFADIGDGQNIEQNLSTFSGHMSQIIYIIKNVTANDLVLMDELGSGTDPSEGSALAIAILHHLKDIGAMVMITTHYNDLKNYAYTTPGLENGQVEFDFDTLQPTYKLRIGIAGNSHAFSISERLGMPPDVLAQARTLRNGVQDLQIESILNKLSLQARKFDEKEDLLEKKLAEVHELEDLLRKNTEKIEAKKERIVESSRRDAVELKRSLKFEAESLIRELKSQFNEENAQVRANHIQNVRKGIDGLALPKVKLIQREPIDLFQLRVGDAVFVNKLGSIGIVEEINGKKIAVQVNGMTVRVKQNEVSVPSRAERKEEKYNTKQKERPSGYHPIRSSQVITEINVTGKTGEEAIGLVEKFLDQALLAGYSPVKIIHGKGSGSLRKQIHEFLEHQSFVSSHVLGSSQEGGAGVTLVTFS